MLHRFPGQPFRFRGWEPKRESLGSYAAALDRAAREHIRIVDEAEALRLSALTAVLVPYLSEDIPSSKGT